MTSIAATISIDQRGPSGIYIISDSRITWGSDKKYWDAARKTYSSKTSPDIFGFLGDAFFSSMILGQIVDQLDTGLLFENGSNATERHIKYIDLFKSSIGRAKKAHLENFSIIHGSRENEFMNSSFKLWITSYDASTYSWNDKEVKINQKKSALLLSKGSGKELIQKTNQFYNQTTIEGTSRSTIMSFCDAIRSGEDPLSSPPPQLAGIWRKGSGISFGMIFKNRRYIGGLEIHTAADYPQVIWFNENFEMCDGETMKRAKGSSIHPKPQINKRNLAEY